MTRAALALGVACILPCIVACIVACASAPPAPAAGHDDALLSDALRALSVTPEMGSPHAGERAPDFELATLDGGRVSSSALRGRPMFVHFTATWCPYCREELPALTDIARASEGRGSVVLIDVKEGAERWRTFGAAAGAPVIVAFDDDGAVAERWSPPRARPMLEPAEVPLAATALVDADGTIRAYVLADSRDYDPTLKDLRIVWERMLAAARPSSTAASAPASSAANAASAPSGAPVVAVHASEARARAGETVELEVAVDVPAPYHVMSNAPSDPAYIATELAITSGAALVDVSWPAPTTTRVGDAEIATFQGRVVARARVRMPADAAPGALKVDGTVRYQACSEKRCFMPRAAPFSTTITVER